MASLSRPPFLEQAPRVLAEFDCDFLQGEGWDAWLLRAMRYALSAGRVT